MTKKAEMKAVTNEEQELVPNSPEQVQANIDAQIAHQKRQNDIQVRCSCLDWAVKSHGNQGVAANDIVATAKAYAAYITGE